MERSVLDKLLMNLCKMGTSKCKHGSGRPGTVHNELHNWLKACILAKVVILSTNCNANCNKNSNDLGCLKMLIKFYFM